MAALTVGLLTAVPANAAERFYGVTAGDRLVTFNSDSPGAVRSSRAITGTGRASILAIDVRPATGQLYGLADNDRLYRIETRTGRARRVGPPLFEQRSAAIGFDFNPTVDKIRVVNAAGQNARIDPDTGALADGDPDLAGRQPDRRLRYDANDSGFSTPPRIGASAYTNSRGEADTELYGIDQGRNALVRQEPPNDGVLNTVGRLGVNAAAPVGFDIASRGSAYAAFGQPGAPSIGLFRVNLSSGRASRAARFNAIGTFRGRRRDPLRALTAAGRVPNDRTPPRVRNRKLNSPLISQLLRGRVLRLAVSCNEACDVEATFRLGGRIVGRGTGSVLGTRGTVVLRLKLSRAGKRIVRRVRPSVLRVALRVGDAAGNTVSTGR